jgi:hypothetical protein
MAFYADNVQNTDEPESEDLAELSDDAAPPYERIERTFSLSRGDTHTEATITR